VRISKCHGVMDNLHDPGQRMVAGGQFHGLLPLDLWHAQATTPALASSAPPARAASGNSLAAVLCELAVRAIHLAKVKERDGVGVQFILDEEFLRLRACAQ
ncbi:MAG: hypothetical protein ACK56I_37255, partial [bacterium]